MAGCLSWARIGRALSETSQQADAHSEHRRSAAGGGSSGAARTGTSAAAAESARPSDRATAPATATAAAASPFGQPGPPSPSPGRGSSPGTRPGSGRGPALLMDTAMLAKEQSLHRTVTMERAPTIASRDIVTVNLACVSRARTSHPGQPSVPPSFARVMSTTIDHMGAMSGRHPNMDLAPAASMPVAGLPNSVMTDGAGAPPSLAATKAWSESRRVLESLIKSEVGRSKSGLLSQAQRLRERLERLGLDEVVMEGDGNCQFRALSNELFGTPAYHELVRSQVIRHLRAHRGEFAVFLGEDFDEYLAAMSRPGTWGDELTLRAASDSYGALVRCITSEDDNWYITYEPHQVLTRRELFVVYLSPIHYNCVKRSNSLRRLRDSLSSKLGATMTRSGSSRAALPPVTADAQEAETVRVRAIQGGVAAEQAAASAH